MELQYELYFTVADWDSMCRFVTQTCGRAFQTFGQAFEALRILTGKKHPKIKFRRLRKIRIRTFGSLVHQINSF